MNFTISRSENQSIPMYFMQTFIISSIPTYILALGAAYFIDNSPSPYIAGISRSNFWLQWLFTGLLIPALESIFLIYPTSVAYDATKSQFRGAIIGAAPLVFLHILVQWQKIFVIGWSFYVQAFSFIELKKQNINFKTRLIFVISLHAVHNSIGLLILYI
jgi:hypothetical protein